MSSIPKPEKFVTRHIGPREHDIEKMLREIGVSSIDQMINETVPDNILLDKAPDLDEPLLEVELLSEIQNLASKNLIFKNYIGMGYNETITPSVIRRNIFENPGWYTQYTPYQAEISQGRLEALLNFQTMVSDLTGMSLANASLLDEGTSAAEAVSMFYGLRKGAKKKANCVLVSDNIFPQTIDVLNTRSKPIGVELSIKSEDQFELTDNIFAIIVQYPGKDGSIKNYEELFKEAKEKGIYTITAADILSLTMLKPPGEMGADCVVGSTQRFGVPLGFGGPHAAYFATREEYKRAIPGRIIGVSVDIKGRRALRMALQTREQHIKRERATSNICTAQVLLAIMAGMYAVYHGAEGLRNIAKRIYALTQSLAIELNKRGLSVINKTFFDTLTLEVSENDLNEIKRKALEARINLNYLNGKNLSINIGETTSEEDIENLVSLFNINPKNDSTEINQIYGTIPGDIIRKSEFLTHEVFSKFRSETEMMRYIKSLEKKDLSLTTSIFPFSSHLTITTLLPAKTALAGFVPCAEAGRITIFLSLSPLSS